MAQRKRGAARSRRGDQTPPAPQPSPARFTELPPVRALTLPLTFTLLLIALGLLPSAQHNPALRWSFWGAGAALLAWSAALLATARGRRLVLDVVLRKQHYVQACAQLAVFLYWGWYWREVYDSAHLIAAQLLFAYAFDVLLTWSRRDTYTLGFGPFPIIFSINLFLWFKPDWFYLQFVMVAVGFGVKELLRWNKEGRRTHIFNPSSFPLGLCSIVLILTGTTHLTWGPEIATTLLYPPHIYLLIFLVSLPGQYLFGVASMTLAAVTTTFAFSLVYVAATGTHFFLDSHIPIAVFLGMHLLFNDPSTSPRSELGRIMFGVCYGCSVIALFSLLGRVGVPTFYDKLLAVPILNLVIQGIDWCARSTALKRFDPAALGSGLTRPQRNFAYMALWAVAFGIIQIQTGTQVVVARGNAFLEHGQVEEAIVHYRDVARTAPEEVDGHRKLGDALMAAGRGPRGVGAATTRAGAAARYSRSAQQPRARAHPVGRVAAGCGGIDPAGGGAAARLSRRALQPRARALHGRRAARGDRGVPRSTAPAFRLARGVEGSRLAAGDPP